MKEIILGVIIIAFNIAWFLFILAMGIYALRAFGVL